MLSLFDISNAFYYKIYVNIKVKMYQIGK